MCCQDARRHLQAHPKWYHRFDVVIVFQSRPSFHCSCKPTTHLTLPSAQRSFVVVFDPNKLYPFPGHNSALLCAPPLCCMFVSVCKLWYLQANPAVKHAVQTVSHHVEFTVWIVQKCELSYASWCVVMLVGGRKSLLLCTVQFISSHPCACAWMIQSCQTNGLVW